MDHWHLSVLVGFILVSCQSLTQATNGAVSNGCARLSLGDGSSQNPTIPQATWYQTPSVVNMGNGYYRAMGRVIHLTELKQQLVSQKQLNFDASRSNINIIQKLEILAETVYVEGTVSLHGINTVKIYAREIVASSASSGSKIDFSAPTWSQIYARGVSPGSNGVNGEHGIGGPTVDISCDVIRGSLEVVSNGGNGHKGQRGGDGENKADSAHTQPDISSSVCTDRSCGNYGGRRGVRGQNGGTGGNAGRPGNGGNAGRINIRSRTIAGRVQLKSCRGSGAQPAQNGRGGRGGAGGRGGRGRKCYWGLIHTGWEVIPRKECKNGGQTGRASSGAHGSNGASGTTSRSRGRDGAVSGSNVQSGTLDQASKITFPVDLIKIMRRLADDLLLGDSNDQKGRDVLRFILSLANERNDVGKIKKAAKRKLGFLGKAGYDIFGKIELFAPRIKWEALVGVAENIKTAAESYERDFNGMQSTIQRNQNLNQMASMITATSKAEVKNEEDRLVAAKGSAESEKRLYVQSITQLEQQMSSTLLKLNQMLPDVYDQAKFNADDLFAVLQGITGFFQARADKDPLAAIDTALGLAQSLSGKQCLQSLSSSLGSIKKWLTFGKNYRPLVDSSDLDFDQMDVASVPEIMQANLEMNKEKLAAELVCLLDVASRPQDIAEFKQVMESFFIAGTARIDLIAKVMDLDNDIGGYDFDIELLKETQKTIEDIGKTQGASLSLQQTFLENLLSTYRELERSFMRHTYELHKAFEFRTLWQRTNPLRSFQRVATESAQGTGRLSGVVQLTGVLQKIKTDENKAVNCFTTNSYTTDIKRWRFSKEQDKTMFEQLAQGYTKFSLNIQKSCATCYNMRLIKIYIELYGSESQPDDVPDNIHLQVRHLSGSYFRAGDNTIKQYRQPVSAYRNIKFDRFTLTNEETCKRKKKDGKNIKCSFLCLPEDDSRWQPMCNHPLNAGGSSRQDRLSGMEECKSPFGIYELNIPVDANLACTNSGIVNTNCKDLDLTKFTKMNVWTHFIYWSGKYPTGPDDRICSSPGKLKRNVTGEVFQPFPGEPDDENLC